MNTLLPSLMLICSSLLWGCSASGPRTIRISAADSGRYLAQMSQTKRLFTTEKRFASYSQSNGSLSVYRPKERTVLWTQNLPGFDAALSLSNAEGAALWNASTLLLAEASASQKFDHSGFAELGHMATSTLGFSFINPDAQSFRVIKELTDGNWQQENFSPAWTSALPSSSIRTSFSPSGLFLVSLDSEGLHYGIMKSDTSGRLLSINEDCQGISSLSSTDTWKLFDWMPAEDSVFIGSKTGKVLRLSPSSACEDGLSMPRLTMSQSRPVLNVQIDKNKQVIISQPGEISIVDWSASSADVKLSIPTSCMLPLGALRIDAEHLLIACFSLAKTSDFNNADFDQEINDQLDYILIKADGSQALRGSYLLSQVAGVAIDIEEKKLYIMSGSSLGRMIQVDLTTGLEDFVDGIFIDGILDR